MKISTSLPVSEPLKKAHRIATKRRQFALAVGLGLLLSASAGLQAQTLWNGTGGTGGNGTWSTPGEWSLGGVPTSSTDARFQVDGTRTTAAAAIDLSGAQAVKVLTVGSGKSVTLNMATGSSLALSGNSNVGSLSPGTGTGPANLTIAGPGTGSATFSHIRFDVFNSSSLVFTGKVTSTGTGDSSVGRGVPAQGSSSLSVLNGASVGLATLAVGRGSSNNAVLVSGTGSSLTTSGGFSLGVSSTDPNAGNSVKAESGGQITSSGLGVVGQGVGDHSNYFEVTGAGSILQFSAALRVGDQTVSPNNIGGNYLRVSSGGTAKLAANLDINNYNDSSTNYGSNYVLVDSGGILTHQTTNVRNKGLLQLAVGGAIEGRDLAGTPITSNITVDLGGRFEAAGTGLGAATTVNTAISNGGSLAVGLDSSVTASTLVLSRTLSKMTLNTGSTLEFGLFGNGLNDSINFTASNIMTVGTGVNLRLTLEGYAPAAGNSWTLITGSGFATGSAANLAAPTFVLPSLGGGLAWNTTKFNQTDGWMISVIPEPSSLMLLSVSFGALLIFRRRRA